MELASELEALPARVAALRSGDVEAVRGALHALAAPAWAVPPPPVDDDADHPDWQRWTELASAAAARLTPALAPLLCDARFCDAALALACPLLAALLELVTDDRALGEPDTLPLGHYVPLKAPLVKLLERELAAGAALDSARLERVLRCLRDAAYIEPAHLDEDEENAQEQAQAECWLCNEPALTPALIALIRRPWTCESDAVAAGAALCVFSASHAHLHSSDSPVWRGVFAAAALALPAVAAADASVPRQLGGLANGFSPRKNLPPVELLFFFSGVAQVYGSSVLDMLRTLLMSQPGTLAAFAHCISTAARANAAFATGGVRMLEKLAQAPGPRIAGRAAVPSTLCRSALLDPELCLSELLSTTIARLQDGPQLQALFIAACTDNAAVSVLQHPPEALQLAAAASTAMLAAHSAELSQLLLEGERLRTLARAHVRACAATPSPELSWQDAALLRQRNARLRAALSAAAAVSGLHARPPSPPSPLVPSASSSKRTCTRDGGATLSAADVNRRRYDSVTLLVGGAPLYVNGMLMESASPLLADLLSGVAAESMSASGTLPVVTVPPPADVAPTAFHALCCAAVEHTYTSGIAAMSEPMLLPLWCVARHLQMEALQAYCEHRLAPALHADPALLRAAAGVAMRHRSDALLQRVAAALLAEPLSCDTEVQAVLAAASTGGADADTLAACDALADAMAAAMRDALQQRNESQDA
jgi:hypothetical protein